MLYRTKTTISAMISAENEDQARYVMKTQLPGMRCERQHAVVDPVLILDSSELSPAELESIPFGSTNNRTCKEMLNLSLDDITAEEAEEILKIIMPHTQRMQHKHLAVSGVHKIINLLRQRIKR